MTLGVLHRPTHEAIVEDKRRPQWRRRRPYRQVRYSTHVEYTEKNIYLIQVKSRDVFVYMNDIEIK